MAYTSHLTRNDEDETTTLNMYQWWTNTTSKTNKWWSNNDRRERERERDNDKNMQQAMRIKKILLQNWELMQEGDENEKKER